MERLKSLGIYGPGYVLNVGHEDPRKGSRVLAEAFSRLPEDLRDKTRLVIAYNASETHKAEIMEYAGILGMLGVIGDPELLHDLGMSPAVHSTGWCDDLSLRALYRNTAVMVFPPLYEGYGLPILEAMRCGCPVVCGDNSSQPEVTRLAGDLVDVDDPDLNERAMRRVLSSPSYLRSMSEMGLEQASRFSWPRVAPRTLGAIRGESVTFAR